MLDKSVHFLLCLALLVSIVNVVVCMAAIAYLPASTEIARRYIVFSAILSVPLILVATRRIRRYRRTA